MTSSKIRRTNEIVDLRLGSCAGDYCPDFQIRSDHLLMDNTVHIGTTGYPSFRSLHKALPLPDRVIMKAKVLAAISKLKHLEYLGSGRGRIVYATDSVVFKIPYTINAIIFNETEVESYQEDPVMKARCRMINLCGLKVVAMERLRPASPIEGPACLDIEYLTNDGNQCGADSRGRLKVYDYEGCQLGAGDPVIDLKEVTGYRRWESPYEAQFSPFNKGVLCGQE